MPDVHELPRFFGTELRVPVRVVNQVLDTLARRVVEDLPKADFFFTAFVFPDGTAEAYHQDAIYFCSPEKTLDGVDGIGVCRMTADQARERADELSKSHKLPAFLVDTEKLRYAR